MSHAHPMIKSCSHNLHLKGAFYPACSLPLVTPSAPLMVNKDGANAYEKCMARVQTFTVISTMMCTSTSCLARLARF
eukprot:1156166-Pelagomonas_calceolata.AAC.2